MDAGYTNGPSFIAPYRGTRYHLNEWVGNNLEIYKELFNLCHSIARNVIERVFGLFKKRWSILCTPSFFNIKTQIRIMNACCMLNNFIRVQRLVDPILEDQNAAFLASIDEEILSQTTMEEIPNNSEDCITCVHDTDEWTTCTTWQFIRPSTYII